MQNEQFRTYGKEVAKKVAPLRHRSLSCAPYRAELIRGASADRLNKNMKERKCIMIGTNILQKVIPELARMHSNCSLAVGGIFTLAIYWLH